MTWWTEHVADIFTSRIRPLHALQLVLLPRSRDKTVQDIYVIAIRTYRFAVPAKYSVNILNDVALNPYLWFADRLMCNHQGTSVPTVHRRAQMD